MDTHSVLTRVTGVDGVVEEFATARLTARRIATHDQTWLDDLHADAEVMATIGGVRTPAASARWLAANLAHWERFGFGQWMLHRGAVCIGRGGLRRIDESVGEDLVEVGYVVARNHWGQGFATEATRAFIEIAASHYGMDELGAITLRGNNASTRVLEKCGFVFERWVDHPIGPHRFLRYRSPRGTAVG